MKRLLLPLVLMICAWPVAAQVTATNARRTPTGSGAPSGSCVSGPPFGSDYTDNSTTPPTIYKCKSGSWSAVAGGTTSAPASATYITQTPNASLTNEQALSLLATGIPLITTTTGVISISSVTNDAQTKASIVPNTAPSSGQVLVGNAGGTAYAPVSMSGDATLASTGALTLASTISAAGPIGSATVAPIITFDAKGRLTTVTSATITPAVGSITGLGTNVATALAVTVGSAGAFVTFNGAGGAPSSVTLTNGTGLPTTGLTGTLQAAQEPAHTGDVTNSAGSLALSIAANAVTLAKLATQATNTVLGNATSGTAVPTALAVGTCSTAGSALIWTTNTGFGCNTSITAAAVPASGLTGATLASGVTASSLTSLGTITTLTATTINAHTLGGTISGGGNQINNVIIGTTTPLAGTFTTLSATSRIELATGVTYPGNITDRARIYYSSGGAGLVMYGAGSTYDVDIINKNGSDVISIPTGTTGVTFGGALNAPSLATSSAVTTGTLCWTTGTGLINVDTTTTCLLSAGKFKQHDLPLINNLDMVLKLRPVSYSLKPEFNPTGLGRQEGFFAEDVAKADPLLVSLEGDGTPHAVRYQQLTARLAGAIQELNAKVERYHREKTVTAITRRSVRRHARAN